MTFEELELFKSGKATETDFGARVQIDYWPSVHFTQGVTPGGPSCTGRKARVTVFAPDGAMPVLEDEDILGEFNLKPEELEALPSWELFKSDLFAALEAKHAAAAAAQAPPA